MSKTILAKTEGFTPLIDKLVWGHGLMTAAVFGKIWRYCQMKNGVCQASIETMASELDIDRATFMRHIKILEKFGYILDHTPKLRNRPHIYSDTGKAGISISITGVAESDTSNSTVAESNSTVAESNTHCDLESHEDSIKIEDKKLNAKFFEESNKAVDYILEHSEKYPYRDKIPEQLLSLTDAFYSETGIKPSKSTIMDWIATTSDWLESGILPEDVINAYAESRKIGFAVGRPGSLTTTCNAMAGLRRKKPAIEDYTSQIEKQRAELEKKEAEENKIRQAFLERSKNG